jgi:hypothetical protein
VDWGIQIDCTELATITDDRVQTWYRLNWQWANNESTCNNTKVSNVKWISTTILPVYSCCYYYRSLVSIDYPDRRVRDRYLCKLRTDTRYDQSTITSWETYSIKAWEGWDPEGGSRYSASQAITSPDKRSGDFFWFIFCFFLVTGERWAASAERVTETSCSRSVRRNQSSLRRFATEWNKFVFLLVHYGVETNIFWHFEECLWLCGKHTSRIVLIGWHTQAAIGFVCKGWVWTRGRSMETGALT